MKNPIVKLGRMGVAVSVLLLLPSMVYAYDDVMVKDGAKIRGSVKFDGKVGKLPPLQVTQEVKAAPQGQQEHRGGRR